MSFSTVQYIVTFRRSKTDPQETKRFNSAEAAYHFALGIEVNGGITIVAQETIPHATTPRPTLTFGE